MYSHQQGGEQFSLLREAPTEKGLRGRREERPVNHDGARGKGREDILFKGDKSCRLCKGGRECDSESKRTPPSSGEAGGLFRAPRGAGFVGAHPGITSTGDGDGEQYDAKWKKRKKSGDGKRKEKAAGDPRTGHCRTEGELDRGGKVAVTEVSSTFREETFQADYRAK